VVVVFVVFVAVVSVAVVIVVVVILVVVVVQIQHGMFLNSGSFTHYSLCNAKSRLQKFWLFFFPIIFTPDLVL